MSVFRPSNFLPVISIYVCTMSTAPQTDKGEEDVIVGHGGFIFKHFLHSDARLSKLKTNEDP